jgi:lipoprotein-anchoring transpeptidase ErfK/SrfK
MMPRHRSATEAPSPTSLQRRQLLALGAAAALAACTPPEPPEGQVGISPAPPFGGLDVDPDRIYASIPDERFPLDGADLREVDEQFLRTTAKAPKGDAPGTIVIDTSDRFLYLVQSGGRAIRYGVGVGRQGATWRGRARIAHKADWPGWTPTPTMIPVSIPPGAPHGPAAYRATPTTLWVPARSISMMAAATRWLGSTAPMNHGASASMSPAVASG